MSREINPFGLRMAPDLREKIEAECASSGRSMNAEIVYRLEESFMLPRRLAASEDRADRLRAELVRAHELLVKSNVEFAENVRKMDAMSRQYWAERGVAVEPPPKYIEDLHTAHAEHAKANPAAAQAAESAASQVAESWDRAFAKVDAARGGQQPARKAAKKPGGKPKPKPKR